MYSSYHRLTRANTPASAPLRRFLPFSPWRAPARLRIKSQKSLGNPSLAGAKQFCRAEMCPAKERPAGNTCRISKGLDAVWAYFCPSKPCLPLSTDGSILQYFPPFVNEIFVNAPSCFSQPKGYNEIIEAILVKPACKPAAAIRASKRTRARILTVAWLPGNGKSNVFKKGEKPSWSFAPF